MSGEIPEISTVDSLVLADTVDDCVRAAVGGALPGLAQSTDGVPMDADLVAAGLDSLAALAMMTAIEETVGLVGELDVTAPFRFTTPAGIAAYLRNELERR
jgi:acyl carrier protein